jgi:tetratricopeptide (TPR) repeat protein
MALDLAKKSGKPLFVDFFGVWCPPCNILDETVFHSPAFLKQAKDMVLLKLDADDKISWDLKSKYAVRGYPTVVLATTEGEEITRFVGAIPAPQIITMMKYAVKNKNISLNQKLERYKTKPTAADAMEIIEAFIPTENYAATLEYIPMAMLQSQQSIAQKEMLMLLPALAAWKQKTPDMGKTFLPLLKTAYETYPVSDFYYPKHELMNDVAGEMKDESLKKWIHETNVKNIQRALAKPKFDLNQMTKLDLMALRTDSYSELGLKDEEKKSHAEIVKEYDRLIAQHKQNPKTNRGYNLERMYSLYKSGEVQQARTEYEKMITVYPHEFAFHYNYASVLKDLKDWDPALLAAQNALKYSYGDNQLRAIYLLSEIEYNKGLKKEPLQRLSETIQATELPKDETVRTHRYVKKLAELKKKIEEGKATN